MIKSIVKDIFFLGQKSEPATKQDFPVGQDLMDTLQANQDHCVGMAANMIGVKKRIIIVKRYFSIYIVLLKITNKRSPFFLFHRTISIKN